MMDRWMDGSVNGWIDGSVDRSMDGCHGEAKEQGASNKGKETRQKEHGHGTTDSDKGRETREKKGFCLGGLHLFTI